MTSRTEFKVGVQKDKKELTTTTKNFFGVKKK